MSEISSRQVTSQTTSDSPALDARGLAVSYGGIVAVSDVSISIDAGTVLGIIGPNGAGKTTLVDALSGFVAHAGSIRLDGSEISHLSATDRARSGLARTWQSTELFDDLTVTENLIAATRPAGLGSLLKDLRNGSLRELSVSGLLDRFELTRFADIRAADLPLGRRRLVGVARALAAQPRVLMLDEPAAGLDSDESVEFGRLVRRLVEEQPLAVLLIDHDAELVFGVSDRVTALDFGQVVTHGPPAAVRADRRVVESYLGTVPR